MATDPRIDEQKDPVNEALVTWNVGPVHFESLSHAQDAIGQSVKGLMNSTGYFSTKTHDADGNHNEIIHGNHKSSAQTRTSDTVGHSDLRNAVGGVRTSIGNGQHEETRDSHTHAVDGPHITASSSGIQNYGTNCHGQNHMEGDQNLSVENGSLAFSSTKGLSINSNDTVHLGSDQQISQDAGTNWAMTAQSNSSMFTVGPATITSTQKITLQVGQSQIIIDQNSITLQVGQKGIKIDSSGVSITKTAWVGDSSPGAHDASAAAPPTKFS